MCAPTSLKNVSQGELKKERGQDQKLGQKVVSLLRYWNEPEDWSSLTTATR